MPVPRDPRRTGGNESLARYPQIRISRTPYGGRIPRGFRYRGSPFRGLCRDVSDAGIRAEFDDPLTVGGSGLLILRPPTGVLELRAQVAYIEKQQVGLLFLFETSWERRMTIEFIAAIANDGAGSALVRS